MQLLNKVRTSPWISRGVMAAAVLLSGLFWAFLIQLIDFHSLPLALASVGQGYFWLTALFLGWILLFLLCLTGSLFVSSLLVGIAFMGLAFVDYYKLALTFLPLTISDFSLIGQMGEIAQLNQSALTLRPTGIWAIAAALLWLAATFLLTRKRPAAHKLTRKQRLTGSIAAALLFWLVFWGNADACIFTPLKVPAQQTMNQTAANRNAGMTLGLWRAFYCHMNRPAPTQSAPTENLEATLDQLLQELENSGSQSAQTPSEPTVPAEPAFKPEDSVPAEPEVKPEDPAPAEPTVKPEDPVPTEPEAKPEDPAPTEPTVKPEEPAPTEPEAKPEEPAPAEPVVKPDYSGPEEKKPNIILILSESFFDITTLDGVTYATDPIPEFHSLKSEGVSGAFYSRTLGYGTCSIELEVLTGINTVLLNNEDLSSLSPDVFGRLPNVPSLLVDNGYRTSLVHTYNDSIYNRRSLFKNLNFYEMYFTNNFAAFHPPAKEAADYSAYLRQHVSGSYYSDDFLADLLFSLYEKNRAETDAPLFLYGISMENHGPHTSLFRTSQVTARPTSALTGEAKASLYSASQGISNASASLGKIVDYFRNVDEPTVIVFFGDHRPGLGLSAGGSVYSELGMANPTTWMWSLEECAQLYATEYLIWANDEDYLPAAPGSTVDTSCNYLGVQLLDLAGIEKPTFWRTLAALSQTRSIDTAVYHRGTDGSLSYDTPTTGQEGTLFQLLKELITEAVYGTGSK